MHANTSVIPLPYTAKTQVKTFTFVNVYIQEKSPNQHEKSLGAREKRKQLVKFYQVKK